ncbi:MAG TPA: FixH family protein [Acetobacteraceae bacterium]|nr:FixH family protein [Acetobacteraceae bacterium]
MSYIDWRDAKPQGRSAWRFFPWAVVGAIALVVAVNAGMVYAALHSFPGAAEGDEGFALSNHYDVVLERAQHEAALGWVVSAQADDAGRAVVLLTDRAGAALHGATVEATAERPLGAPDRRLLAFHEMAEGRYVADASLPTKGQWELTLTTSADGQAMAVTRRVIVR